MCVFLMCMLKNCSFTFLNLEEIGKNKSVLTKIRFKFIPPQDVNIANVLVERGYAKFTHQKNSTRNTTRERSYPPPPQSDNGPVHLPVETLTVPLEMGELMLDDDIEEYVDEGTRTG